VPCIKPDCTRSVLPTKLCIVFHNLARQLFDDLLAYCSALAASHFGYRLCNCAYYFNGHSNRSLEEFAELLTGADIGVVADIRKVPMSRANPQFNKNTLPGA